MPGRIADVRRERLNVANRADIAGRVREHRKWARKRTYRTAREGADSALCGPSPR